MSAGEHNFSANPLFVDADGKDNVAGTLDDSLMISPKSPCLQRGANSWVIGALDFPWRHSRKFSIIGQKPTKPGERSKRLVKWCWSSNRQPV